MLHFRTTKFFASTLIVSGFFGFGETQSAVIFPPAPPQPKIRGVSEKLSKNIPTDQLIVRLRPGWNATSLANRHGLKNLGNLSDRQDYVLLQAKSVQSAKATLKRLKMDRSVEAVFLNEIVSIERDAFTPNDTYFPKDSPSAGWPGQWQLVNPFVSGRDIRVQGAWNRDLTGSGVTIGLIDDGFQTAHPDLSTNFSSADSYDFGENDTNVNPSFSTDRHGTCTTGLAAARGGNGAGITGVAPYAKWAGLRIDFDIPTSASIASAVLYRSSGSTKTIAVKNSSFGSAVPFSDNQAEADAMKTSALAGTIHVKSAGNSRPTPPANGIGQDCNKDEARNSPYVITVGAIGSDGLFSSYSNFGACLFVVAPSDSNRSGVQTLKILTTDRTTETDGYNGASDSFPNSDYSSIFGGTSAAAPLVSGVMALGKQVKPTMDVRFAKQLLVRTSDVVDPTDSTYESDGGWKTNAAGFKFNQNYGFGLIDADGFTQMATQYTGVTYPQVEWTGTQPVMESQYVQGASIPDNNMSGISRSFYVSSTTPLETVQVSLSIAHSWRGDLEAYLTSPQGTTSRLFIREGADSESDINWTFTSNAFWGENPQGTWTLSVRDVATGDTGVWMSYSAMFNMGTLLTSSDKLITGGISLSGMVVPSTGRNVTLELRNATTDKLVEKRTCTLDENARYYFYTKLTGTYRMAAKTQGWLRARRSTAFTIGATGNTNIHLNLTCGDIDDDNSVTIFDYSALATYFDMTPDDPKWFVKDATGVAPYNCDLDGDGFVSIFDYSILATNFDMNGYPPG